MSSELKKDYKEYVYKGQNIDDKKVVEKLFLEEVTNNNYKVVENLLELGADINCTDDKNANALHYAAYNNNVKAIDYLIENNIKTDQLNSSSQTPLFSAVINNSADAFKKLLPMYDINQKDNRGLTIAHYAIYNDNADFISTIFDNKDFDKKVVDNENKSLLHYTVGNENAKIARLILQHVDLLETVDSDENTPVLAAHLAGNELVKEFLLSQGANKSISNKLGETLSMSIAAKSQKQANAKHSGNTQQSTGSSKKNKMIGGLLFIPAIAGIISGSLMVKKTSDSMYSISSGLNLTNSGNDTLMMNGSFVLAFIFAAAGVAMILKKN